MRSLIDDHVRRCLVGKFHMWDVEINCVLLLVNEEQLSMFITENSKNNKRNKNNLERAVCVRISHKLKHRWLHSMTDDPPTTKPLTARKFIWTNHKFNVSGTPEQYVPYSTTRKKIQEWIPPSTPYK
ncbi:hypothetical protein H8959_015325 [Pygathrix nigripes]